MTKFRLTGVTLPVCLLLVGCASAPRSVGDPPDAPDCIERDVRFLAHPQLDGRQPKSHGSIRARQYITRRFTAYGLEPWGDADGFCHPVKFGTNVVGVLPGQDPALADEIVLVSAHYDHLGNGKLGAMDNASGVSVLLELARRMTQAPLSNRRTLCLAAFDCEERPVVWGAMAFTRRPDFDPARIAAVVNLDMIGRPAFGCMDDTLFLGRTHGPPALMDAVLQDALVAAMPSLASFFWGAEVLSRDGFDEAYWHARLREIFFFQKHQADVMAMYGRLVDIAMGKEPLPTSAGEVVVTPHHFGFIDRLMLIPQIGLWRAMRTNRHWREPDLVLASYPLLDEDVAVADIKDGQRHLGVLVPVIRVSLWDFDKLLSIPRGNFSFGWEVYSCRGDTDALIDYCLRRWKRLAEMSGRTDAVEERGLVWQRVLREIDANRPSFDTYEESLGYRLMEADCADYDEWQARMPRKKDSIFPPR
jgi:Peptidase family M28